MVAKTMQPFFDEIWSHLSNLFKKQLFMHISVVEEVGQNGARELALPGKFMWSGMLRK